MKFLVIWLTLWILSGLSEPLLPPIRDEVAVVGSRWGSARSDRTAHGFMHEEG